MRIAMMTRPFIAACIVLAALVPARAQTPAPSPAASASPAPAFSYDGTWSGTTVSDAAQGACLDWSVSVAMKDGRGSGDSTMRSTSGRISNWHATSSLGADGKWVVRLNTDDATIPLANRSAYFAGRPTGDAVELTQFGTNSCKRTLTLKR